MTNDVSVLSVSGGASMMMMNFLPFSFYIHHRALITV